MFPTLGHLLSELFNTNIHLPIPMYGTMMALAFLAAYCVIRFEFKRKAKQKLIPVQYREEIKGKAASFQDLIWPVILGFLIGFKLLGIFFNPLLSTESLQDFVFSTRGHWPAGVGLALIFGLFTYIDKEKKKREKPIKEKVAVKPGEQAASVLLVAAISGVIGAKIFHQLENWEEFIANPLGSLFSSGGLTFYGGLIFGALAVVWYTRRQEIKTTQIMDMAAPAIVLAYAVGRIGCMTAGDGCWGIVNTEPMPEWLQFLPEWMWAFDFPHNVINEGVRIHSCQGQYCHILDQAVFPTPFYETVMNLIIFGLLWAFRKIIIIPGMLFSVFLVLHGFARFLIEKIRVNTTYHIAGKDITQAEIISVVIIMLGITGIVYFYRKHKKNKSL
ncbi:MAG: prolipoprotein diacylglyceryl transferase [Bacteroidales bacterium]